VPGQFVSLKVSDEELRRSYSIASLPGEKNIDLAVDVTPMGVGSKYILSLKVGDLVEVLGFLGKFVVNEEAIVSTRELLFVGTGTGAVPLKPMIEDLLINKNYKGRIDFVWGMRYEADLYWQKEIDKLQRDFDNFHFEIVLSKPGSDWPGMKGHVGDVMESLMPDWENTDAYLCGAPEMIEDMKNILRAKGIVEENINFERFA
jgi:NAD(P)H-flavin reductase